MKTYSPVCGNKSLEHTGMRGDYSGLYRCTVCGEKFVIKIVEDDDENEDLNRDGMSSWR